MSEQHTATGTSSSEGLRRRTFLKATSAAGALTVGVGASVSSASGGIAAFDELSVDSDNRIVDESGNVFKMRGLNVPDPKRVARTKYLRGKTARQIVDLITNTARGWHPHVIRLPANPVDIGEHPLGNWGPKYGEDSPPEIDQDRRKQNPPQPPAFTRDQVRDYLERYYAPIVERCRQRGVYCIVDYHRQWHEQPPGDGQGNGGPEGTTGAENHLPYDSEYTNYWAYNEYYGKDKPASWGWVDQTYRNESDGNSYVEELHPDNLDETPYAAWSVNEPLVEEARLFWDEAAATFADDPHVIFEPYNEPTAPGIWGPENGCRAFKQKPLWHTYLDEFAAPIIETIREHAPANLLLMGLPGWCQSTQALHWRDFADDDLAVTWHNYGRHAVSQLENWLNDTDYEYMGDERPIEPPKDLSRPQCYGWEPYEAQGLQEAYEVRPVAVTEFGWIDQTSDSVYCKCVGGQPSVQNYGEPFLSALESDERLSWVAWSADVRWLPTMFDVDFAIPEVDWELTNANWYETDLADVPKHCVDLPCEWTLRGAPNMGKYVKQLLAEKRAEQVPFETETRAATDDPPAVVGNRIPGDPDDDGHREDVDGDGALDFNDLVAYYQHMDDPVMDRNVARYDYTGDEKLDFNDLVELYGEL